MYLEEAQYFKAQLNHCWHEEAYNIQNKQKQPTKSAVMQPVKSCHPFS